MVLSRVIITAAAALMLSIPSLAAKKAESAPPAQPEFTQTLSKATLAVYRGKQECAWKKEDFGWFVAEVWSCEFKRSFTCTGTVIANPAPGEYIGLSAGHCIDWDDEKNYYVSEGIEPDAVLRNVEIVKSENDKRYDYVVFTFHSAHDFAVVDLNGPDDLQPAVGTPVVNSNFALGIGKELLEGKVVSEALSAPALDGDKQRYLVSIGIGPGASGSPVVDAKTHKIVGLVEAIFPMTQMSTVVIPTGKQLADFLDDDSAGLKPLKPTPKPAGEAAPTLLGRIVHALAGLLRAMLGKK